jgi:glycosyltransferase involved in cell wall biosynthesis
MLEEMLKIAVWNSTGLPPFFTSGVGKMFINVVLELQRRDATACELLMPADDPEDSVSNPEESPLQGIKTRRLPYRQSVLESLWRFTGLPTVDRWAGDADWLFCPRELWCPPGRVKYAITVHDVYLFEPQTLAAEGPSWRRTAKRKLVWERAIRRADIVFTVSEFSRCRIAELFDCPLDKIVVAPNAVDPAFTVPCAEQEMAAMRQRVGGLYVLQVGGLTNKKGASALLNLAGELGRRRSELKLVILGPVDEPYRSELSKYSHLEVLERGISPNEIKVLTSAASACVLLSEYEGFGIPVLEAMSCGVPVLAANRAALPEVAGDTGILVEPTETTDIADRLERLHRDIAYREAAVAEGRGRVAGFTWQRTADLIIRAMRDYGRV